MDPPPPSPLDDTGHRSREEQERFSPPGVVDLGMLLDNVKRRESRFQVQDQVWKKIRVLYSAAEGVMAKLAPKYVGPYEILEKKGPNT